MFAFIGLFVLLIVAVMVAAIIVALIAVNVHGRLATLQTRYQNAFSLIDLQFRYRQDLAITLVEMTQDALATEAATAKTAIEAAAIASRTAANSPGLPELMTPFIQAETELARAMGQLWQTMKATTALYDEPAIAKLRQELHETTSQMRAAQVNFNDAITSYNRHRQRRLNTLIARLFGFQPAMAIDLPPLAELHREIEVPA